MTGSVNVDCGLLTQTNTNARSSNTPIVLPTTTANDIQPATLHFPFIYDISDPRCMNASGTLYYAAWARCSAIPWPPTLRLLGLKELPQQRWGQSIPECAEFESSLC
jgi:hypothetical protein